MDTSESNIYETNISDAIEEMDEDQRFAFKLFKCFQKIESEKDIIVGSILRYSSIYPSLNIYHHTYSKHFDLPRDCFHINFDANDLDISVTVDEKYHEKYFRTLKELKKIYPELFV